MAGTFTSTGTYSNLTRLELEQLRRADFLTGGKALTVGDSDLPPEGVVGKGDINAEPYLSGLSVLLDDVYGITPPLQPGPGLSTLTQVANVPSETVHWFGPTYIQDGTSGAATATNVWTDTAATPIFTANVQVGDILLIKPKNAPTDLNTNCVGTVSAVTATSLTLSNINNPTNGATTQLSTLSGGTDHFEYLIVRPSAVQLFAVPGSGATGSEQTFMMVVPGSTLHNTVAPTVDQINNDRIPGIVPAQYSLNSTVDRSDAVYDSPGPRQSLDLLGYRVVLYPDNGLGTGPNLAAPITAVDPVISTSIPITDQRMTIDYKAGIVRFSCEPSLGGQIKVAGGVNATTGRMNLYATFWAVDQTLTQGAARSLYAVRSTNVQPFAPGKIGWFSTINGWSIGSSSAFNNLYVRALDPTEISTGKTEFGAVDVSATNNPYRYFAYRQVGSFRHTWMFLKQDTPYSSDPYWAMEMEVGEKLARTVGDITSPPQTPADFMPTQGYSATSVGARNTDLALASALKDAAGNGYGTVHLRRGRYFVNTGTIVVPPGIIIEGEGNATVVESKLSTAYTNLASTPVFKFGANTKWGVYDPSYNSANNTVSPTQFVFNSFERIEGYDVVYNPVRRCWGIAVADATLNAVFFNEMNLDGSLVFPGLGVNLKSSANNLYTSLSPNSSCHTSGHYPRLAHHDYTDDYVIVWVEQVTESGVVGPQVQTSTFNVQFNVNSYSETSTPSVQFSTYNNQPFPVGSPYVFSDHPSVAVDKSNTTPGQYTIVVQAWTYAATVGAAPAPLTLSQSAVTRRYFKILGSPFFLQQTYTTFTSHTVVSSTDCQDDGNGGFLFAWSRRAHQLLSNTQAGTLNLSYPPAWSTSTAYLTDPAVSSWTSLGVGPGSKFMYLGQPAGVIPASATYNILAQSFLGTNVSLSNSPKASAYGLDGTVIAVGSPVTNLNLKENVLGGPYLPNTPWQLVSSTTGTVTGAPTNVLTDGSVNFVTAGVVVGDVLYFSDSVGGQEGWFHITAVATNSITVSPSNALQNSHSGNLTYQVYVGRPFNYAIVPPSYIDSLRFAPIGTFSNTGEMGVQSNLVGNSPATGMYVIAETEPDLVRIARGNDNWLLVYQSFRTTGAMSASTANNFDDNVNASFLDKTTGLFLRDAGACYREHIGTNAILLNDMGGMAGPSIPDSLNNTVLPTSPQAIERYSRDIELSQRSLGSRAPITSRPNFQPSVIFPAAFTGWRHTYNYAFQVAANNWCYRWPIGSAPPSLIPDITWTGTEWVVVSPTKRHVHSYTGNYIVTGTGAAGQVYFGDATWYFGTDNFGPIDSNFLRATITTGSTPAVGDLIYFVSAGTYGTVAAIHSEHIVQLAEADSALLNKGSSPAIYGNIEWALVRGQTSAQTAGIKNPGYRVGNDGRVILSTNYITFANEITDDQWPSIPYKQSLMRRNNVDLWAYLLGQYEATPFVYRHDGHNLPGNLLNDPIDSDSRYLADISYNGVGVGEPRGSNEAVLGEGPCVAIAWGETMYCALDHVVAGPPSSSGNSANPRVNYVGAYRQSFGPYNNGIRNLKIQGKIGQTFRPGGFLGTVAWNELKVLSQSRVLTRHWVPGTAGGFFATDGYRNVFGTTLLTAAAATTLSSSVPFGPSIGGSRLAFVYTNAVGRHGITIHGPRPTGGFRNDVAALGVPWETALRMSSPKVIWDGSRFVAAWADGGTPNANSIPAFINLAILPGDEDRSLQGSELVGTDNGQQPLSPQLYDTIGLKTAAVAPVEGRSNTSVDFQFVVHDIAYSGKVYCVVWSTGFDWSGNTNNASVLGVTLFDAANVAGDGQVLNAMPLCAGQLTANGTTVITDSSQNFLAANVQSGDILVINNAPSPNQGVAGRYVVVNVSTTTLTLDVPVAVSASGLLYSVHHPIMPSGAISHVIGAGPQVFNPSFSQSPQYDAFATPKVIWDGKAFVIVYYSRVVNPAHGSKAIIYGFYANNIATVSVPEHGFASTHQIKRIAPPSQLVDGFQQGIATTINPATGLFGIVTTQGTTTGAPGGDTVGVWPNLKVGDIMVVTSIYDGSTYHTTDNGWYPILAIDYSGVATSNQVGTITVGHAFSSSGTVFGAFMSGGVGDVLNTPAGSGNTIVGSQYALDISPNPRVLTEASWGSANQVMMNCLGLFSVVYNDVDDEYAILYVGSNGSAAVLCISTWKRGLFKATPEYQIASSSAGFISASLAWNGRQYLAVWSDESNVNVQYAAISPTLCVEDQGFITTGNVSSIGSNAGPILGSNVFTVPGPGYGSYTTSNTTVAQCRNLQVLWNSRMNRWVISGSYVWQNEQLGANTVYSSRSTELVSQIPLSGTTVTAITGNSLTLNTTSADLQNMQPGMKLLITNSHSGNTILVAAVGIVSITGSAPTVTLKADTGYFPTSDAAGNGVTITSLPAGSYWILPREDIFCWTLGWDAPAVAFHDADESFLENVSIGGVVDVEEKYNHLARPIWQAGSPAVGEPDKTLQNPAAFQRGPQYRHLFLTPAGKLRLPMLTNVRSTTKVRHGYGLIPGAPYIDRFSNNTLRKT
jgi:hypothetical protein